MAEYLRTANIKKTEAWYTFTAAFMKTLEYPMEAVCLTREQWEEVMTPLLPIVLQKSGIARVFPRTMIYSSTKYHGLGVMHPWYHQQIKHLQALIQHTDGQVISSVRRTIKVGNRTSRYFQGRPVGSIARNYHNHLDVEIAIFLRTT